MAAPARVGAGSLCVPLDDGVVEVRGPDARRFLNGQLTQNVRDLAVGRATRSARCDDRGRVRGLFDVLCLAPDRFWVVGEGADAEALASGFERFLLMDDAVAEPIATPLSALVGPDAVGQLAARGLPVPGPGEVRVDGGVVVWDRPSLGEPGARVAGVALPPDLDATAAKVLRVEAGEVRWPDDLTDKQLVAELGLVDRLVSFDKGCYVGQETNNRLDSRGEVRKRLCGVRWQGPVPTGPVVVTTPDGAEVGRATSAVRSTRFGAIALAIVRRELADAAGDRPPVRLAWDGLVIDANLTTLPFEP
jgi:folate-binding protein YgfZ